jgi:hypothetical protein
MYSACLLSQETCLGLTQELLVSAIGNVSVCARYLSSLQRHNLVGANTLEIATKLPTFYHSASLMIWFCVRYLFSPLL